MSKSLDELVSGADPAIEQISAWVASAAHSCEVLPPSEERGQVLLDLQITTGSILGALAYNTGGILVDHGWLRFLGSGHGRLTRTLSSWNRGRAEGLFLFADDVAGGFFALNGGALGVDRDQVYYWPPDRLFWEPLRMGLTDFLTWSLTTQFADFYQDLRWIGWTADVKQIHGDYCYGFYPFLWTEEGSIGESVRRTVSTSEAFDLKFDIVRQLCQS